MNYRKILNNLGIILAIEAAFMVVPAGIALYCHDSTFTSFAITIGCLAAVSTIFISIKAKRDNIYAKDGYTIVVLTWLLMSCFGALPFTISGYIPNYVDALFEVVSGFTTTGSTILTDIEALPKSLLFWRSFTHFIGGMGILVFAIAILPKVDGNAMHVMRAEVPGPTVGKLVSKIRASARILYTIYFGITAVMVIFLFCGGMPLFDSITNAFATAGTGGFCALNNSIAGYNSAYAEVVIAVFMMIYGFNFNLFYLVGLKDWKRAVKDEELRWYLSTIAVATVIITIVLTVTRHPFPEALRLAFFQVTSIISTTGFTTADFDLWPVFTKAILLALMFIGGCVGSTGGGLKVSRVAILIKNNIRSIRKSVNPRTVETVKMDGKSVDEEVVNGITGYFSMYMLVLFISILALAIDGKDLVSTITSVITCITNVGPGFGIVGPTGNFSTFSNVSKIVLTFDMLAGRLELIPVLMIVGLRNIRRH